MTDVASILDTLPQESFLRIRIHTVRVVIEQRAADSYSKVSGQPPRQSNISAKLLSLLPHDRSTGWADALAVIHLAQYCYRRTSDVLHGRSTLVGVTPAMVDEWEEIATKLEELYRMRFASGVERQGRTESSTFGTEL